jgi:hypothetical protein
MSSTIKKEARLPEIIFIPASKLKLNPDNPRQIGKKEFDRLVKSLEDCPEMFNVRPLLISQRTGENIIIGGNMRFRAAKKLDYKEMPCVILAGITEAKEKEIAIKDNGTFGEWDYEALANAWDSLPLQEWGVGIYGFDKNDAEKEWDGMPGYEHEDQEGIRQIIVHFNTQEAIDEFTKLMKQPISDKTRAIWFPKSEKAGTKNKAYKDES